MRSILAVSLLLAACSQQPAAPALPTGTFAAEGRDRLCIAGEAGSYRAGLIAYGPGDINCSASGRLERAGDSWVLVPRGEGDCRIPLTFGPDSVTVARAPAACAYYCGPGASLEGKRFTGNPSLPAVTDLAGDPLC